MAGQVSIKVDAGTGNPVDFSQTNSAGNYRQAVAIGDPLVDANYVTVANGAANVVGSMVITNTPTVTIGAANNIIGSVTVVGAIPSGNNIIGTVGMTGSIPSGSNIVGTVTAIASNETSTIYNGTAGLTPQFSVISFAGVGNNVVVGTVSSKRIRVVAMSFLVSTATALYLGDSNGAFLWGNSTNAGSFAASSGIVLPYCPVGYFQTGSGNALIANLSASSQVAGSLTYLTI